MVDLKTHFFTKAGVVKAVDGVIASRIAPGEVLGLVGKSGCGKSMTGFSILGLIDPPGRIVAGAIALQGRGTGAAMPEDELRDAARQPHRHDLPGPDDDAQPGAARRHADDRGDPGAPRHAHAPGAGRLARDALGAGRASRAPSDGCAAYPHELSGGMRQRVAIAIAFINKPDLVIADEPTTALDVTIQAQILHEAQELCRRNGTAMIWITHDLAVVVSRWPTASP